MPVNPLLWIGAAAVGYFGYVKPARERKKRAAAAAAATPSPQPNAIVFDTGCGWSIPASWYGNVGKPKLQSILTEAGDLAAQKQLNSHQVAHRMLTGQTPANCPLPAADANIFDLQGLTDPQANMMNLYAHMIEHVETSLVNYFKSGGTALNFPAKQPDDWGHTYQQIASQGLHESQGGQGLSVPWRVYRTDLPGGGAAFVGTWKLSPTEQGLVPNAWMRGRTPPVVSQEAAEQALNAKIVDLFG